MFKNKTVLETKRNDKTFTLDFDVPSSLVELIDVLTEFRNQCLEQLNLSVAQEDKRTKETIEEMDLPSPAEVAKEQEDV